MRQARNWRRAGQLRLRMAGFALLGVLVALASAAPSSWLGGTTAQADEHEAAAAADYIRTAFDECLFVEVAAEMGLGEWDNTFTLDSFADVRVTTGVTHSGGGVAMGDLTGNGHDDIYVTSNITVGDSIRENALYLNRGDGSFVGGVALARELGISLPDHESADAIFFDYNGNGLLDLYVVGYGRNYLFENNGDATFTDVTDAAGDAAGRGQPGLMVAAGDYTGNGYPDLLVVNWGNWKEETGISFFLGVVDGWPEEDEFPERRWPPYENWPEWIQELYEDDPDRIDIWEPFGSNDLLLRNNGDGTFTDTTEEAGLDVHNLWSIATGWADLNNNGLLDAYIGTDFQGSDIIYFNNGDGTFTFYSQGPVRWRTQQSMNFDTADLTYNGFLDFYVTNIWGEDVVPRWHGNTLILNEDGETFVDHSRASQTHAGGVGWSAPFEDFNHSSYWDIWAGNGFISWPGVALDWDIWDMRLEWGRTGDVSAYRPSFGERARFLWYRVLSFVGMGPFGEDVPSLLSYVQGQRSAGVRTGTVNQAGNQIAPLFINLGDVEGAPLFAERSSEFCIDLPAVDEGVAIGDFTGNGATDLIVSTRNAPPHGFHYYQNRLTELVETNFVQVQLIGQNPNRYAIGARIEVDLPDGRTQIREVTAGVGWQSQRSATMTFGLGPSESVDEIRIRWLNGDVEVIPSPPTNHRLTIEEGQGVVAAESVPLTPGEPRVTVTVQGFAAWQPYLE